MNCCFCVAGTPQTIQLCVPTACVIYNKCLLRESSKRLLPWKPLLWSGWCSAAICPPLDQERWEWPDTLSLPTHPCPFVMLLALNVLLWSRCHPKSLCFVKSWPIDIDWTNGLFQPWKNIFLWCGVKMISCMHLTGFSVLMKKHASRVFPALWSCQTRPYSSFETVHWWTRKFSQSTAAHYWSRKGLHSPALWWPA